MKRKLIAIGLSGAIALALCGCNFNFNINLGGRFSEKKVLKFFQDTLDAEEYDVDDLIEACEEDDYDDNFEDGIYVELDKSGTKDLYKSMKLDQFFPSVKGSESSVAFFRTNDISSYDRYASFICDIKFEDQETAEDFFDDTLELWNDMSEDINFDDDEELNEAYIYYDSYGVKFYAAIYRDGQQVVISLCANDTDDIDDFCDEFKVTSPSELED
ncbi:MAG: hypothetical protein K6G47_01110 [Clostridia bacterium]|nr:hypothetical protein [Clostridia bacterium]